MAAFSDLLDSVNLNNECPKDKISQNKITESEEIDRIIVHKISVQSIVNFINSMRYIFKYNEFELADLAKYFIEIGIFFQELTIDAAKTAQEINIPYLKGMQGIHWTSREFDKNLFNVKILWNGESDKRKMHEEVEIRKTETADEYEAGRKYFEAWKCHNINYKFSLDGTPLKHSAYVWYDKGDSIVPMAKKRVLDDVLNQARV